MKFGIYPKSQAISSKDGDIVVKYSKLNFEKLETGEYGRIRVKHRGRNTADLYVDKEDFQEIRSKYNQN